ncbi:polycystin family receptor for egg jelly-like [Acipenser ruthenus]|uniref:polycystin family receptor for egg jelly-like n=1 Tax=Acipenser ruthenus TaxID=7906 RepID=UPI002741D9FA|nr:polycystin family receptor for egg jelly-like [Acipenser ruthenus]
MKDFCSNSNMPERHVLAEIVIEKTAPLENFSGVITFSNDTVELVLGSNVINLHLNFVTKQIYLYYFSSSGGLYYSKNENTDNDNSLHYIVFEQQSFLHLIKFSLTKEHLYTFSLSVYLDKRAELYRSLNTTDTDIHLYSSGPAQVGVTQYIVWFLPLQDSLVQCKWNFKVEIECPKKHFIMLELSYSDNVRNGFVYIPDVILPFDPTFYAGFVSGFNCSSGSGEGYFELSVYFEKNIFKRQGAPVYFVEKPCTLPRVVIQKPSPPIIASKKKTEQTIFSSVAIDCSDDSGLRFSWKIYNVTDNNSLPDWDNNLNVPLISPVDKYFLFIPKDSLEIGLYLLNFTVSFSTAEGMTFKNSDRVFVEIQKSDLEADILGGSYRTVDFNKPWVLNGSLSEDPDAPNTLDGLHFVWYCSKNAWDFQTMIWFINHHCHPDQNELAWPKSSEAIVQMPQKILASNTVYHFRLHVQKDSRESYFDQTVNVLPGSPPEIQINCIQNCGASVISSNRLIVSSKCISCDTDDTPSFEWSLFSMKDTSEIDFDWIGKTETGRFIRYLSINTLTLQKETNTAFELQVKVSTSSGTPSTQRYPFHINEPPKAGTCSIAPTSGIALVTTFIVQCSDFVDENLPLKYKVRASVDSGESVLASSSQDLSQGTIVYFGYQPITPPFVLPCGISSQHSDVTLYIQVYDQLEAFTQVSVLVKVKDLKSVKGNFTVAEKLREIARGSLTSSLKGRDYVKAGGLVYAMASVLNAPDSSLDLMQKTALREFLLNISSSMPMDSIHEVSQLAASISKLTKGSSELSKRSQELSVTKLVEVSSALNNYSKKGIGSETTENIGATVMSAVANTLEALTKSKALNNTDVSHQTEGVGSAFTALKYLSDAIFHGKVPGQNATEFKSKKMNITYNKNEPEKITDSIITNSECTTCFYPKLSQNITFPPEATVSVAVYEFEDNPYSWLSNGANFSTSVTAFEMLVSDDNGNVSNLDVETIEVVMVTKDKVPTQSIILKKTGKDILSAGLSFEMIPDVNSDVLMQFFSKIDVSFSVDIYLGNSVTKPIGSYILPRTNTKGLRSKVQGNETVIVSVELQNPYVVYIPQQLTLSEGPNDKYNVTILLKTASSRNISDTLVLNISIFSAQCSEFDGSSNSWSKFSCKMGPLTDKDKVHCICNSTYFARSKSQVQLPKTYMRSVAGKVFVFPYFVDLSKIGRLFETVGRNMVTLITVFIIVLIYTCLAIWAFKRRRFDETNRDQVIVLPDNDPFDKVCYLVTIYTGTWPGSGTSADVFFRLIGSLDQSDIHLLKHPKHKTFHRDDVDTFLVTTKTDLGDLHSVRFWHNNAGNSPDWYLSRVKVENLYNKQVWYFMCRKWFTTNKDGGILDRTFLATNQDMYVDKKDFFAIQLSVDLKCNALWFSVFARVIQSSFTRLQRLSCCFALLMSSLLTNIVLFRRERDSNKQDIYMLQSFMVGIESSLINVPVQIILTSLFKYSKQETATPTNAPYHNILQYLEEEENRCINQWLVRMSDAQPRDWRERLQRWYLLEGSVISDGDNYNIKSKSQSLKSSTASLNYVLPASVTDAIFTEDEDENDVKDEKETKELQQNKPEEPLAKVDVTKNLFPKITPMLFTNSSKVVLSWWCVYVAWCFIIICISISGFFIILYGLSYGTELSLKWIFASTVSVLQTLLIVQPIKIACISAISSFRKRRYSDLPWPSSTKLLEIDMGEVPQNIDEMQSRHSELIRARKSKTYKPLGDDEITAMMRRDAIKTKAFIFLKGIVSHFIVIGLVLHIAYSNDHTRAFYYKKFIKSKFSADLSTVDAIDPFYLWMNNKALPLLHDPSNPPFVSEINSIIVGLARIRQIRAKRGQVHCIIKDSSMFSTMIRTGRCQPKYGKEQEEKNNYNNSWETVYHVTSEENIRAYTGWVYESNSFPWDYESYGEQHVYGTGGYTVYFFPTVSMDNSSQKLLDLKTNNWLDGNTWAVILELTVYNPDVNLFCAISVVFEASPFGDINGVVSVKPFSMITLDKLFNSNILVNFAFVLFLIVYLTEECITMIREKKRYIRKINNLINFGLKSIFLVTVGLQISMFYKSSEMLNFYNLYKQSFIPLHAMASHDEIFRITVGFLFFFSVLKTLRYAKFIYTVRLAQSTILVELPGICSIAIVLLVFFLIYTAFGHLAFGQQDVNFNNYLHAAETVLSYCVLSFQKAEFTSNFLLAAFYLTTFMLVMVCILINLFQSVIILSYEKMRRPVHEDPSDEAEVVAFLVHKLQFIFYSLIGRKVTENEFKSFNGLLYGHPKKMEDNSIGLNTKDINGKKIAYILI